MNERRFLMKTTMALTLSAVLFSVAPGLALAAESDSHPAATVTAMTEVTAGVELSDQELASVEGQGGCGHCGATIMFQSQYGAANIGVQANDVNVASGNNIASGNNVAILSHAHQFSYLKTVQ
jgi:hypothetical protein